MTAAVVVDYRSQQWAREIKFSQSYEIEKAVRSTCESQERTGGAAEEARRGITVILAVSHPSLWVAPGAI